MGNYSFIENSDTTTELYTEFGITIEAYVGKLVQDFMLARYSHGVATSSKRTYTKKTDKDGNRKEEYNVEHSYGDTIRDLVIVILTSIGHTSFEVSLVPLPGELYETSYSTGIHFYF